MEDRDHEIERQRREYFRSEIGLSLLVTVRPPAARPRSGVPFLPPRDDGSDYRILRVRDLSASGCRCEVFGDAFPIGAEMTGFLYLDDDRGPLELELHVIRREERDEGDRALVGFRFLGMREAKRRRIMKALFREYRRQRRAERESP
jgi:c-di-GMP-binding flagellar brake protein YcgR